MCSHAAWKHNGFIRYLMPTNQGTKETLLLYLIWLEMANMEGYDITCNVLDKMLHAYY